jgi:hypothetical protein
MKARKTSFKLIKAAISEKWIRPLALFHALKFRYVNSCVYSYKGRFRTISGELGVSIKTLYSYVKILRSNRLIYDHKNNLMLKSFRLIRHEYGGLWKKCTIIIPDIYDLFDVECLLYAKILEDRARKQAFRESVRQYRRRDWRIRGLSENSFYASLSYRTIANILNLSKNKTIKVIKNLNRMEVIRSQKQKPELIMRNASQLNINLLDDFPGRRFMLDGNIFEQYGLKHEFIQFPITLKRITLNQYIKLNNKFL